MSLDCLEAEMKIIRYDTMEDICNVFMAPMGFANISEIQEVTGYTESGEELKIDGEDFNAGLMVQDRWGFADTNTDTVHIFYKPEVPTTDVLWLIGHEVAHLKVKEMPQEQNQVYEELVAEWAADVATTAYQLLIELQQKVNG
jgi:hypothetical protein